MIPYSSFIEEIQSVDADADINKYEIRSHKSPRVTKNGKEFL